MTADEDTRRLSAASLAEGDATGWFETLYIEAEQGRALVPWDLPRAAANLLTASLPPGAGRRALVVGCGLGRDAEYLAGLGYATTAFDISATAIRLARERHAGSPVDYRVADLLDPPGEWRHAFDLVVESNNVQALPRDLRSVAIAAVAGFVAPEGTLLVLAAAAEGDHDPMAAGEGDNAPATEGDHAPAPDDGPPWPLTRAEVTAFATGGLRPVAAERIPAPDDPLLTRWRAYFRR